jgi:O-antigen ligase
VPPQPDDPPTLGRRVSLVLRAAIVCSYAGLVVLRPGLPHNTAFVDPLFAAVSFGALLSMARQGSPASQGAKRALPWVWLIILGSLLGLSGVGMAFWGVSDLIIGLFAILTFFCFWHLVYLHHLERYAVWGTAAGLAITVVTVVTDGRLRNSGLFSQPNYPGHYAVLAAVILVYACRHWWAKALAIAGMIIVIQETGSFGSIVMVAVILVVLGWRLVTRYSAILAALLVAVGLIGVFVVGSFVSTGSSGLNTQVPNLSGSINSTRFAKSKGSRFELWSDDLRAWSQEPLGLGPAGILHRQVSILFGVPLEVHNDVLSFLVERGVVGAIGFIGFWVALWRVARRRGLARLMLLTILVAGLFRETMHYRHLWLLLALAYVYDSRRPDPEEMNLDADASAAASEEPGGPVAPRDEPGIEIHETPAIDAP